MEKQNKYVYSPNKKVGAYPKEYILYVCENDRYFFDMRLWRKPKNEITKGDISYWIRGGCVPCNSGHLLHCIQDGLMRGEVAMQEVVSALYLNRHETHKEKLGQYANRNFNSSFFFWLGNNASFNAWLNATFTNIF